MRANPNLIFGGDWLTAQVSNQDTGGLVVVQASSIAIAFIRPAEIRNDDNPALFAMGPTLNAVFQATRFLRSDGASAMAERIAHTPVPIGGYEANPALSVRELVTA